ncbi:MAG: rhodanese-like domain-containing protein [Caulobacteraceae bacterium]
MRRALLLAAALIVSCPLAATAEPSRVDYAGFAALARDLAPVREAHLVTLDRFWEMAGDGDTLILDARSADAFARGHIAGAVNLPLTDFTAQSLATVIGRPDRRVLIYCNNNFTNDIDPVVTKMVRLALNVQTFVNLHGYGYENVWELSEAVDFNEARVRWVKGAPMQARNSTLPPAS